MLSKMSEGNTAFAENARRLWAPRGRRPCARAEGSSYGNWEVPCLAWVWRPGPHRESQGSKAVMNEHGKSDSPILPMKPRNKECGAPHSADADEGRGLAKGNPSQRIRYRTQRRGSLQHTLGRIRHAAAKDKQQRFTALWHHVYDVDRLRAEYFGLKPRAAPGVDGETWTAYGENLERNLKDLSSRLRRGAYRAKPVKRVYRLQEL